MRSCSRLALAFASSFSLVFFAADRADATPGFPDAISRELALSAPPPCATCHAGGVTRRGTVTTPFGTTMRSRGLQAYDEASLKRALAALSAEKKDSDEDGTPDIEELKAGDDPNVAAGDSLPPPEYGCATSRGDTSSPIFALLMVIGVACARARRQESARPAICNE